MIVIVDALNKQEYATLLDEMFKLRARVFGDRLGWDVRVVNGRETDKFDDLDPAYVIGLDEAGHVVSCVRALQTTGPHMLPDVFSAILNGEPPLRSATIWESTRFCVDTKRLGRGRGAGTVSHATSELMIASLEYARAAGIEDIVTVIDPIMNRVLKRSDNAPYDYVGITAPMGKVPAMAALLDCTEERIARLRAFSGIHHDVFATPEQLERLKTPTIAPAAAPAAESPALCLDAIGSELLAEYLDDQIRSSHTEAERKAAIALAKCLSDDARFAPGARARTVH